MVFSSIQAYLDPANWQQNPTFQTENYDSLPPPQQATPPPPHHGGGDQAGSSRPGSMVERARMANIALPEAALKCPRCESTNTKFCYFNNYNLTQPRHFCKTCRRYWTRGGALRNVPVGGGCRRNKRSSKGSSSSSTSKSEPANSGSTNSTALLSNTNAATTTTNILQGLITSQVPQPHLFPPLTHLANHNLGGELASHHGQISAPIVDTTSEMNFDIGGYNYNLFSGSAILSSSTGGLEQWPWMHHAPQLPNFLGGFDASISQGRVSYHSNYQHGGVGAKLSSSSTMMSEDQLALVKTEANNNNNNYTNHSNEEHHSNLAKQLLGSVQGNERHWSTVGTTAWTDNVSGFSNDSSTSNPL